MLSFFLLLIFFRFSHITVGQNELYHRMRRSVCGDQHKFLCSTALCKWRISVNNLIKTCEIFIRVHKAPCCAFLVTVSTKLPSLKPLIPSKIKDLYKFRVKVFSEKFHEKYCIGL